MVGVYDLRLRPIHYASVSGGKDSLYMLGLILANPKKYPLDMVVNFDLEIEWQIAKNVVNEMQRSCEKIGVKFVRIKPRKTWQELYDRYGFPSASASARWCNASYKLDCKRQLNEWIKNQNCRPVAYIGLCADEKKRFKYEIGSWENQDVCYPLAEEGISERKILEWARKQPIFEDYYKALDRMGCMACPLAGKREWAYLLYKEPDIYERAIKRIAETERMVANKGREYRLNKMTAEELDYRIRNKWLPIIKHDLEHGRFEQLSLF